MLKWVSDTRHVSPEKVEISGQIFRTNPRYVLRMCFCNYTHTNTHKQFSDFPMNGSYMDQKSSPDGCTTVPDVVHEKLPFPFRLLVLPVSIKTNENISCKMCAMKVCGGDSSVFSHCYTWFWFVITIHDFDLLLLHMALIYSWYIESGFLFY